MINLDIWILIVISNAILLLIFWRGRNAVWGGLALGLTTGIILAIFFTFKSSFFDWHIVLKGAILGTISGFIAELMRLVAEHIK